MGLHSYFHPILRQAAAAALSRFLSFCFLREFIFHCRPSSFIATLLITVADDNRFSDLERHVRILPGRCEILHDVIFISEEFFSFPRGQGQ